MFSKFSKWIAKVTGHPLAFGCALLFMIIWFATGPFYHFSDTWQLVVNTATTIITFLMVFIIQNSQNRETLAIQIKLNELIRSIEGAHNKMMDVESLSDKEIEEIHKKYMELTKRIKEQTRKDTGTPDIR